jgi:hypothetical protein
VLVRATAMLLAALAVVPAGVAAGGSWMAAVPALREQLTTSRTSSVAHDTETMALVAHAGRLFAATDQWEYPGAGAAGQVLVKKARTGPWSVFERTQSLRVQALDSFSIPKDQGIGRGHSLLLTQATVGGRSSLQWLFDRAGSFGHSYALASQRAQVRAFGAHESGGEWAVYAGVEPTGILRGTWSRRTRSLVFRRKPELSVTPSRMPGVRTQKVTGFADCAGALYATVNTKLFRRNDGALAPGVPRWSLVYEAPAVGLHNSGLRGLTCVRHHGAPALLVSTEGNGNVYRFDHLSRGRLRPRLELSTVEAIGRMLNTQGSIAYVIAAYNNFATIRFGAVVRQAFGVEWKYAGTCPATRTCQPTGFDAAACFVLRTDRGSAPTYDFRCLAGPDFTPVRSGQAFVSVRTIAPSPFGDGRVYYGGYDCNFYPADGTAWIASSSRRALHLGQDAES